MTLADGDTKSILTDNAKRAIQGNVAMSVTHPVNLVVKFQTNASSAIWWQNLQTMYRVSQKKRSLAICAQVDPT